MDIDLDPNTSLPTDFGRACLIGRAWVPGTPPGPSVVVLDGSEAIDITRSYATTSLLLEAALPAAAAQAAKARGTRLGSEHSFTAGSEHE